MCGICGVHGTVDEVLVASMLDSIKHRGPDTFDVKSTPRASLGGCRLRILGDTPSPLPVEEEDSGPCLLLNGEIYNYEDLMISLIKEGESSRRPCESEVILKLVRKEGIGGIAKLKGMFAIAIVDGDRLVLARDRFGIKPLFYSEIGSTIAFASEVKAILRHPRITPVLDEEALEEIAVFGYLASEEKTVFKRIKQVPPGTALEFENGTCRVWKYHEMPSAYYVCDDAHNLKADAEKLRGVLKSSMAQMMQHGEQEKGIYLSGGLDSSVLALLASQYDSGTLHTFTMADSEESEDFCAAKSVANAIGSYHHEYLVGLDDYFDELTNFIYHYENVIAGGVFDIHGGIAFQMLSRRVADEVRVAFSGEGADELFGGYYWTYSHPLGFSDRLKNRLQRLGTNGEMQRLVGELFPEPEDELVYRRNLFDFLLKGGLSNYHLWSVDRSCSAFGFEVRPAYLHDDIAKLAMNTPIDLKSNNGETKTVLREAAFPWFERFGITDLLFRQKLGMPAAVSSIAVEVEHVARELVPPESLGSHPYAKYLTNSLEAVMFDIFHYFFLECRGIRPDEFDLLEFYREGLNARMYA